MASQAHTAPICLPLQSPVLRSRTLENSPISSCDTSDAEGPLPVNSAAVLKKSQPAAGSSPCRGHVLRKAKVSLVQGHLELAHKEGHMVSAPLPCCIAMGQVANPPALTAHVPCAPR